MSSALEICQSAYRQMRIGNELSQFSLFEDSPYNLALDLINMVIQDINRLGDLSFLLQETTLSYSVGVYSYDLKLLAIDPQRIVRVIRTTSQQGELTRQNWEVFQDGFRRSTIQTAAPTVWSRFNARLELNTIPDANYGLVVSHYKDIPKVTLATDTFPVPERDEDVLVAGIMAYLAQRLGRGDTGELWALYEKKLDRFTLDTKKDRSTFFVRPARF